MLFPSGIRLDRVILQGSKITAIFVEYWIWLIKLHIKKKKMVTRKARVA